MSYVNGFVAAVPAANKQDYIEHCRETQGYFKDLGATRVVDCWGDDVPDGKVTDFKGAVKATGDEKIVYSWIEWPSRQVQQAAMKKMMEDPRMRDMKMPFDGQRMIYGGFTPVLED